MANRDPVIEGMFPALAQQSYAITSPIEPRYNCVAWATGDNQRWWQVFPDERYYATGAYYWPPGVPRENTVAGWALMFQLLGYSVTDDSALEPGFEKVAIYVDFLGRPTHAARQMENGVWSSKLGKMHDIEHPNLECLEGESYGKVAQILARRR